MRPRYVSALLITLAPSFATACEILPVVEKIVEGRLPAFVLAADDAERKGDCVSIVQADFNGDGKIDYAAVLTEKSAPKTCKDGRPWFQGYLAVFFASKLPYANYQVVLLLGHESRPDRLSLETRAVKKKQSLVVHNSSYSTTEYEWLSTGFVVVAHEAD